MKLSKQRLMEMAGLMTEEEQHLKMPFANNLPQGPKRIEWYGKHLAKMMTPYDTGGHEGLLSALLDNPEDFPQNWRVAPEGEVDYIESVFDEIVAFANDYTDMPGFKGTKNALAGLGFNESKISEIRLGQEQIERFEGTANMRDLKTLQDTLRKVGSEWMQEGFEKEDIKEYVNYYIDQI